MMRKASFLGLALAALLITTGCGQKIKQENEQLKAQVSSITAENADLKTQLATLQKEGEDLRAQVSGLTAELDTTKQQLADAKKPKVVKKKRR
jgi:predicted  nucleic acid-binding Zn-ribbon protein